ncbi:hypothetical protein N7526_006110 [Penicillium atrosanguineum]|nr:hypothetical protein N7526_006110 [Penicillium atrosanguineum]
MQSMQRKFGRMTTKRSADDSQVAVLLKDLEDADNLLTKIVDSTKAWRDAWVSIATFQSRMIDEFDGLYAPHCRLQRNRDISSPARTNRLRREYDELRGDLQQELDTVETRITQPAEDAKNYIIPVKKTIKKRNDKKSDFERYQSKVDSLMTKGKRNDRDNANLAKANSDFAVAKEAYVAADDDLRRRLPTLISLLFSLAPYFLRAQVEIQNRMLAHYYTVLHTYCEEEGLPSPSPPMDQVIQEYELANNQAKDDIESLNCLAQGKAIRQSDPNNPENKRPSVGSKRPSLTSRPSLASIKSHASSTSGFSISAARKPSFAPPMPGNKPCGTEYRSVSPTSSYMTARGSVSLASSSGTSPLPSGDDYYEPSMPAPSPMPSPYHQPVSHVPVSMSPAGPKIDHMQYTTNLRNPSTQDITSAIAAKKKRPPPPPRGASFVTALYDFNGHQNGDLVFHEGDRIKIVTKTQSTDDWWEGELRGKKGQFPANYVE